MLFCKPAPDTLPHPEACLVTGITPQQALDAGVTEREFIARIHDELARPGTCGVGYNSLRFDDEFTRYALYRNFYDAYAREWQNGNSRWDLIDVVRMCCALRPDGIAWPLHDDGTPSFKLEALTAANGIEHSGAHDALVDVYATIELAKLLRRAQPKLFDYALGLRDKRKAAQMLNVRNPEPLLHISSRFPASRYCTALVLPLAQHPVNKNSVVVFDLMSDPAPLLTLAPDEIAARVFTRSDDLPEGAARIPLKEVHINKSPMLVTANMLDDAMADRLQLDRGRCARHAAQIASAPQLGNTITAIYNQRDFVQPQDPELMLYSGGFFGNADRQLMTEVVAASGADLASRSFPFQDSRLTELLFRYRARNFPETLSADEATRWREHCHQRRHDLAAGGGLCRAELDARVERLRGEHAGAPEKLEILDAVSDWAAQLDAAA